MLNIRTTALALCLAASLPAVAAAPDTVPQRLSYRLAQVVPLGGIPRWDYLKVEPASRRLFVAHGTEVTVLSLDDTKVLGRIEGLAGAAGVALAPDLGRGFITNGDRDTVTVFDLKTLKLLSEVAVGKDPDSVAYDPFSRRVFAFNGESHDVTIFDAATGQVTGTVELGGTPEFAVVDEKGALFVNIEETAEIVRIDTKAGTVANRSPIADCEDPKALAIDLAGRRLFSVCSNAVVAVMDADSGRRLGTVQIGRGADAAIYDAQRKELFVSNGEGFVSVIGAGTAGKYPLVEAVQTRVTGRTMALDAKTGTIYVPAADLKIEWSKRAATFVEDGLKLYVFTSPQPLSRREGGSSR